MAYTTVNKSRDYFSPKLYTGNAGTNNITGVGHKPDWVWIKGRGTTNAHMLFDSRRGVGNALNSNELNASASVSTAFTAFNNDGFSVGNYSETNTNNENYVSWNWKGGTTSGISAGSQNISPASYSISTAAGFGVYKWSRSGASTSDYFSHGLGITPTIAIQKRTDASQDWYVNYTFGVAAANQNVHLNRTNGFENDSTNVPTSTNYTPKSPETGDYITYLFAPKPGFSSFGLYFSNGNADGPFVYTGFKPAFLMVKNLSDGGGSSNNGGNWKMLDSARDTFNVASKVLLPDNSAAETSTTAHYTDFLSNGFKIRNTSAQMNQGTNFQYLYMAFAEAPLVGTNNIPATAR